MLKNIKVVIVGNTQVGKTCIVDSLVNKRVSSDNSPTVGASLITHVCHRANGDIKLNIWDTAGQEKFMSITSSYYRNVAVAIVVFDLSDRSSFDNIGKWVEDLNSNAPVSKLMVLVGNKKDLVDSRSVTSQEGESLAHDLSFCFYKEVSALNGEGIVEFFEEIADICDKWKTVTPVPIKLAENSKKCC